MKKRILIQLSSLIASSMLFTTFIIFNIGCQKEIKTNESNLKLSQTNFSLQAHIVYTDIPDTTIYNSSFSVDLNNDKAADYKIAQYNSTNTKDIYLLTLHNNGYLVDSTDAPMVLDLNSIIGSDSKKWIDSSSSSIMVITHFHYQCNPCFTHVCGCGHGWWPSGSTGPWGKKYDKYLGMRLHVGTNTYYGWVRLDVFSAGIGGWKFTIKDYAYNSISGQTIKAGQIQ